MRQGFSWPSDAALHAFPGSYAPAAKLLTLPDNNRRRGAGIFETITMLQCRKTLKWMQFSAPYRMAGDIASPADTRLPHRGAYDFSTFSQQNPEQRRAGLRRDAALTRRNNLPVLGAKLFSSRSAVRIATQHKHRYHPSRVEGFYPRDRTTGKLNCVGS